MNNKKWCLVLKYKGIHYPEYDDKLRKKIGYPDGSGYDLRTQCRDKIYYRQTEKGCERLAAAIQKNGLKGIKYTIYGNLD